MRPREGPGYESLGQELSFKNEIDQLHDLFRTTEAQVQKFAQAANVQAQSDIVLSQFGADKDLFRQWGEEVDLYYTRGGGSEPQFVNDPTTAAAVRKTLEGITTIMSIPTDSIAGQKQILPPSAKRPSAPMRFVDVVQQVSHLRAGQQSNDIHLTRSPLRWKMRFVAVAQRFRTLVEELYNLTWQSSTDWAPLMHPAGRQMVNELSDRSARYHTQKIVWDEIRRQIQRE